MRHSLRGQVILLAVTAASLPFVYLSLEVPKLIINQAISAKEMPHAVLGLEVDQISYLFLLSCIFLGLVALNGGFTYFIDTYRSILGERLLRRLRSDLYSRMLRFPLPHFKQVSKAELVPVITQETEPLGGFIGHALVLPVLEGGRLCTYLLFIFHQDLVLGVAAMAIYPLQIYVVPKLQRQVNALARQRVLAVRDLAAGIGDSIAGATEIHAHDTSRYERATVTRRLGSIFDVRLRIFKKKFFIKFLNNFLAQLAPFFFYSAGGYFVIRGELSLGALIAALAAYKDLASPWKELLKYYQIKEDTRLKYGLITEAFHPAGLSGEVQPDATSEQISAPITGHLVLRNVSYGEDGFSGLVDGVNLNIGLNEHVAIIGGKGRDELARLIARLLTPTGGHIKLGEHRLENIPDAVLRSRLAYVGENAHVLSGTVRDNLLYALKHHTTNAAQQDYLPTLQSAPEAKAQPRDTDWLDYDAAGVDSSQALEQLIMDRLEVVRLHDDVFSLGLNRRLSVDAYPELAGKILVARQELRERLSARGMEDLIEPFDESRYNTNLSVAENLLFGIPRDDSLMFERLTSDGHVTRTLEQLGLLADLQQIGGRAAETMVDLFADLPPGHPFFERFSLISSEELPVYKALSDRIATHGIQTVEPEGLARLLSVSFRLTPARHRLGLIDEALQSRLLEARRALASEMPPELRNAIVLFHAESYNDEASVQDNILFGKPAYGQARAGVTVAELIRSVVDTLDMRLDIMRLGLDHQVGTGGSRLSLEQRQKLAIARCLIKNPDLLVVNKATSSLDVPTATTIVANVSEHMAGRGLVWVLGRADLARQFDRVVVMEKGKIVEQA
ncbi:MAG: ABC transporter transmembrane domain-containing protein [Gammaproteobacteria bacterium]